MSSSSSPGILTGLPSAKQVRTTPVQAREHLKNGGLIARSAGVREWQGDDQGGGRVDAYSAPGESRSGIGRARRLSRVLLERCSVAVIPTTATTLSAGRRNRPRPAPASRRGDPATAMARGSANAASPQHAASANANDKQATASSSLASQLRAGLDYELRNGCPNARAVSSTTTFSSSS